MIFPFRGLARSDPAGTLPASGSAVIIRRTSSFHVVEIIIERISNRPVVVPGDSMRVCGRSFAVVLFFLFASARLKLFFCLATVVRNLSGAVKFHSPPRFFFARARVRRRDIAPLLTRLVRAGGIFYPSRLTARFVTGFLKIFSGKFFGRSATFRVRDVDGTAEERGRRSNVELWRMNIEY